MRVRRAFDSAFGKSQMTEPRRMKSMRSSVLMIAIGSIGLAGCQSVGSNGAPPVTGSTTPAGAATSTVAPAPAGIPAPAIPDRLCARRRPRRTGRRFADGRRPPGGVGRAGGRRSIRARSARGAAPMACSALSSPAPRRATAAAPIRRPSMSPAGRTEAADWAANSQTEAGR